MYHYVRPIKKSKFKKLKALDFSQFKRQLDFLQNNYKIISTSDVIEFIKNGKKLPKKPCWLTFDDGYKDHINYVFPELKKRKLHGAFFVSTLSAKKQKLLDVNKIQLILSFSKDTKKLLDYIKICCVQSGISKKKINKMYSDYGKKSRGDTGEIIFIKRLLQHLLKPETKSKIIDKLLKKYSKKNQKELSKNYYMNVEDLKKLIKNKMYVGSHAQTHRWLNTLSYKDQESEIKNSLNFLKSVGVKTNNWVMCYPHGGYNKNTLKILKKNKCVVGLTANSGIAYLQKKKLLTLPRFDTNEFPK